MEFRQPMLEKYYKNTIHCSRFDQLLISENSSMWVIGTQSINLSELMLRLFLFTTTGEVIFVILLCDIKEVIEA